MNTKLHLQISLADVQVIIDHVMPGAVVATADPISGGKISKLYNVLFTETSRSPVILKIYDHAFAWKMQTEVMVLNTIRDGRLPVATIIAGDCSRTIIDKNYALMTKLPGDNARQAESRLTPSDLRSVYMKIGEALRALHAYRMTTFGFIGPAGTWKQFGRNSEFMGALFASQLEYFASLGGDATVAERVRRCFEACRPLLDGPDPVLCHFDLNVHNTLIADGDDGLALTGIVDFESALGADPLLDIAKSLCETRVDCRPAILAGYGPIERPMYKTLLYSYFLLSSMSLCCWKVRNGLDITQESRDLTDVLGQDQLAAWLQ